MNKQIIKGHKMNIQYSKVLYKVIKYIKLGFDKALPCVSTFFNTWNTSLISSRYCQLSLDDQIKSLQLKVSCNCHWLIYIFNLNSDTLPSRQKTQARNVLTWTCLKGHFLNIELEWHQHKLVVIILNPTGAGLKQWTVNKSNLNIENNLQNWLQILQGVLKW